MIRKGTDRVFAFGALLLIAVVWIVSAVCLSADLMPIVRQTVKERWQKATLKTRSA